MNFNYSTMKQIIKLYFTTSVIFFTIILGCILLFIGYKNVNKEHKYIEKTYGEKGINDLKNENDLNNSVIKTNNDLDEKISPNAILVFKTEYLDCGHKKIEEKSVDEKTVNMGLNDMQQLYNKWKIDYFSAQRVELSRTVQGICNDHFIVKDVNGKISVFKENSSKELKLVKETEIETKYLPEIDKLNLKNGVKIYGEKDLNSYIENFE